MANQSVFKNIMNIMCKNNLKVNFYHIAGHTDTRGLQRQIDMFVNSNGFNLNTDILSIISRMNCYVDNITKSILEKTNLQSVYGNQRLFYVRFPTNINQIYQYKMLKNDKL